ncbi:MAG: hypothetical protein DCC56_07710 [Anaerolineae bacterium]|nr:MAG: hypothetical protein DCC56_07710 [Anaerolineae bacterium]WKZ45527.1 MAG: SdrD B-like domain-containing protein [Anaerolineales bacterium]
MNLKKPNPVIARRRSPAEAIPNTSREIASRRLAMTMLLFVLIGCTSSQRTPPPTNTPEPTTIPPTATQTPEPAIVINPLTGLQVENPSLLNLPALLVSISHFPVTARPQAGLSFSPLVFEIYITEGATRFLTTFYGEFPAPESPVTGGCDVRRSIFLQTDSILGNRIWLDANQNNTQDAWERGVGGVCVNLYDANQNLRQQTTTDSNGYYGFNVSAGTYFVAVAKPPQMEFSQKNAGDANQDSDVDSASGWSDAVTVVESRFDLDIGLIQSSDILPPATLPEPKVGPIRSGRLVYADIAAMFTDSCLIYAFASPEVLVELPQCFFVTHDIQGGGYMLEIEELKTLAQNSKQPKTKIDYASNLFSSEPPAGDVTANDLHVYIAYLNQSGWRFDALSQSYWRFVDDASEDTAGVLHPEVDRLTNRQLQFENVIVLFAKHDVVSPTNLDIHLEANLSGAAILFRDGMKYDIRWSTELSEEEIQTGFRKPIRFLYRDEDKLFPLKLGHTWVIVVTPETSVTEDSAGEWLLRFVQPEGAK